MIDPYRVRPIEFNLVVELEQADEKVGSIFLPEQAKDRDQIATTMATVISVAAQAFSDPEIFGPDDRPGEGDVVVIGKYSGQALMRSPQDKDSNYRIVKDKDVLVLLEAAND